MGILGTSPTVGSPTRRNALKLPLGRLGNIGKVNLRRLYTSILLFGSLAAH
jgi:hypothetical protein